MTSFYSISLIRDPARETSQLYLRVARTSAFKQIFFNFLPRAECSVGGRDRRVICQSHHILRFLFSILDTEPPTCGFCPPNKLIDNATLSNIRVNWPRANCSDNSGQNPVITSNRLSGDLFAVPGVYEVVYTVTDQQNNVNRNCSFRITLKSKYLSIRSFVSPLRKRAQRLVSTTIDGVGVGIVSEVVRALMNL